MHNLKRIKKESDPLVLAAKSKVDKFQIAMGDLIEHELVLYAPIDKALKDTDYSYELNDATKKVTITSNKKKVDLTVGEDIGFLMTTKFG